MKHLNLKTLGNILMISSLSFLIYIYYPLARTYFFPSAQSAQSQANTQDSYWIEIPKISASAPIILNVDPWNESEYKDKLQKGVAHAKGSALPGKGGTYLFAHSSDYPWNITRYNTAFFKLHELAIGDTITIHQGKTQYIYTVRDIKEIWPKEVEYLKNIDADLVLQTCTPIGTDLKRLLVFATLN